MKDIKEEVSEIAKWMVSDSIFKISVDHKRKQLHVGIRDNLSKVEVDLLMKIKYYGYDIIAE